MRNLWMPRDPIWDERPEYFEIDVDHHFANRLVFAGLGAHSGGTYFHDSSVYQNHGTLTGASTRQDAITWLVGRDDSGFQYNTFPSTLSPDGWTDFTVAMWFIIFGLDAATGKDWNYFFSSGYYAADNDFVLLCNRHTTTNSHEIRLYINHNVQATIEPGAAGWTVNEPYHLAFTRRGTTITRYLNGASQGTDSYGTAVGASGATSYLGIPDTGYALDSDLADPMLYTRGLGSAEISALADPSNVMLSGLILPPTRKWWPVVSGAPAANAPTGHLYGSLVGPLGGPI